MNKLFRLLMIPFLLCVFALSQATEKVLWSFGGASVGDGSTPLSKLVMDSSGNLYGTTSNGGTISNLCEGCGTVFELSPSSDGNWTETIMRGRCMAVRWPDFRRGGQSVWDYVNRWDMRICLRNGV